MNVSPPSREQVLSEIKRIAAESGGAPGMILFSKETGIAEHHWRGVYWARWSDALTEAGFDSNEWNSRADSEELLIGFANEVLRRGGYPTQSEYMMREREDSTLPKLKTIKRHFGGKEQIVEALRQLSEHDDEYATLRAILPPVKKSIVARSEESSKDGWVYLLKSGGHFKIGRSDSIERRIKEISIALPEAVTLVHSIQTDDPSGIEAYWHKRFSDRRANGEWFNLSSEDIRAFKRRKFQ